MAEAYGSKLITVIILEPTSLETGTACPGFCRPQDARFPAADILHRQGADRLLVRPGGALARYAARFSPSLTFDLRALSGLAILPLIGAGLICLA